MRCLQGSSCSQRWFPNAHAPSYRMVVNLVCDSLDEITYSASLAGLQYSFDHHSEGLSVCVYGYQDKLPLLLRIVLEKINNFQPRADRLEVFKEKVGVSIPEKRRTDNENPTGNPRLREFSPTKASRPCGILRAVPCKCCAMDS